MTLILLSIIVFYLALLMLFAAGFLLLKKPKETLQTSESVSIVISARNEELFIKNCLSSIIMQKIDGRQVEIILIDDASTDRTAAVAEEVLSESPFGFRIIRNNERLGKKKSLKKAIELTQCDLIVTRDADTVTHSPYWLQTMVKNLGNADLSIGPIEVATSGSILSFFDWCENAVLTVVAGGSTFYRQPFLASGANLAFRKKIYERAGGYSSHLHIASGDDVFLLKDVRKIGGKINFIKQRDAVVQTFATETLGALIVQKSRWAGKVFMGQGLQAVMLAAIVFLANGMWIFCLANLFKDDPNPVNLFFVVTKVLADLMIVLMASDFFRKKGVLLFALPLTFLYPLYACTIGIISLFYKPEWK